MFYDFIYLAKGFRMRPKVRSTLRPYIVKYTKFCENGFIDYWLKG